MGKWKISGIVTDETPGKNDGMVTLVEGIHWPDEVPVTLNLDGSLVVGSIRLAKGEANGRPVVLGEGEVLLWGVFDEDAMKGEWSMGFAMCGIIESRRVMVADKIRVTHVAFQDLAKCYSPDYVVKFEPAEFAEGLGGCDGERFGLGDHPGDAMIVEALACSTGALLVDAEGGNGGRCFHGDEWFRLDNGWRVRVFFDGDEVDYVDRVVSPDGTVYAPSDTINAHNGLMPFGNSVFDAKVPLAESWKGLGRPTGASWDANAVRVSGSAGAREVRLAPRESALDAKAKPHLRLVEPVEGEAPPAGAWTELVDFPPLAEGHKRLVVVKGTLPDEEVEHVANGVAEHLQANFGENVAVLVMRPEEAFGVSDFPPKPSGHRRVVTVESAYLDRAGFEGVKAWFKEAVGADDVVMAGAVVKVEDIPE